MSDEIPMSWFKKFTAFKSPKKGKTFQPKPGQSASSSQLKQLRTITKKGKK